MTPNTTANGTFDEEDSYCPFSVQGSSSQTWAKSVACILVLLTSVVANTFVIFIVNKKRKIKTVTNCLVANMACSDLLLSLINMPNMIKEEVSNSTAMPFGGIAGNLVCKLLVFSQDISAFCSILSLIAIAVERFFAIFIPYRKYFTLKNVKYLIAACWLLSALVSAPLLYANKIYLYEGVYECAEDWSPEFDQLTAAKTYSTVTFVLLYAVPLVTICSLYAIVVYRLWHQAIPGDQRTQQSRVNRSKAKKRVLKMLIAIVLAFALCWLPYHVYFLLDGFYPPYKDCGPPLTLYFAAKFTAYANSAVSPCIFICFDKGVRRYLSNKVNPCCEGVTTAAAERLHARSALYSSQTEPEQTARTNTVTLKVFRIYDDIEGNANDTTGLPKLETPDLIAGHKNFGFSKDSSITAKNRRTVSFAQ